MTKIIIDTDLGDDIDDVLAIGFALNSKELEVLGITTVFRNTHLRAKIAKSLLKVYKADHIPVYAGCGKPLLEDIDVHGVPNQYADWMADAEYDRDTFGPDYIIREAMSQSGKISLVAIGPLTNIALAITKEPAIREKLDAIYLMGGSYTYHIVEYNTVHDPEASSIVFSSGIPVYACGADCTRKCVLSPENFQKLRSSASETGRFIGELTDRWYKCWGHQLGTVMLHDPLSVFSVFNKELVKFSPCKVKVELNGQYTRGLTFAAFDFWKNRFAGEDSNTYAATDVDPAGFEKIFMERIFSPCH